MTTIRLKNSVVALKAPAAGDLVLGEVALNANSTSPALYFKDNADNIIKLEPGSGVEPSPDAPTDPTPGDLWYDTVNDTLNYWNGSEWETITGDTDSFWIEDGGKLYPKNLANNVQIGGTAAVPSITLGAGGSITAAGDLTLGNVPTGNGVAAYSSGSLLIRKDDNGNVLEVLNGGSTNNDRTIVITADGSITATGSIQTGGLPWTGVKGCVVAPQGNIYVSGAAGNAIYQGYLEGSTTATITIKSDGDVSIGNSSATFLDKAAVIAALTPEQRTLFATAITAWNNRPEPYTAEDPTTLPADTPLREAIVRATTAGKINLNSDGSITAASRLAVGSTNNGATVTGGYAITAYNDADETTIWARNSKSGKAVFSGVNAAGDYTSQIFEDGSITAKGVIYCGGNAFNGQADGSRLGPDGSVYASSSNDAGTLWGGYKTGSTNFTSRITADGSITAAGQLVVGDASASKAFYMDPTDSNGAYLQIYSENTQSNNPFSVVSSGSAVASISADGKITANTFNLDALPALP